MRPPEVESKKKAGAGTVKPPRSGLVQLFIRQPNRRFTLRLKVFFGDFTPTTSCLSIIPTEKNTRLQNVSMFGQI